MHEKLWIGDLTSIACIQRIPKLITYKSSLQGDSNDERRRLQETFWGSAKANQE